MWRYLHLLIFLFCCQVVYSWKIKSVSPSSLVKFITSLPYPARVRSWTINSVHVQNCQSHVRLNMGSEWVEFNVPLDTIQVISEAEGTCRLLCVVCLGQPSCTTLSANWRSGSRFSRRASDFCPSRSSSRKSAASSATSRRTPPRWKSPGNSFCPRLVSDSCELWSYVWW